MYTIIKTENVTLQNELQHNVMMKYSLSKKYINEGNIYGVKVEKLNEMGVTEYYEEILEVTDIYDYAEIIYLKIIKFFVSPLNLQNVIDDFISQDNQDL